MAKEIKIEGKYLVVFDNVSGADEIRFPAGGVIPKYSGNNVGFYQYQPTEIQLNQPTTYDATTIIDNRTGSVFASLSAFKEFISDNTGFFFKAPSDGVLTADFLLSVAKGQVPGHSLIHKFGRNSAIGTSLVPVSRGGIYRTPTTAVSLEFVSSSASDALSSTGMHEITLVGLDASWNEQTVTVSAHATDGTIAVAITGTWLRLFRAYVSKSGTYATASAGSHVGTITIRVSGGGATWATIGLDGTFGLGQTEIGAYTVPAGFTAFILSTEWSSDVSGTKTTNFYFFQRSSANDVTGATYDGTMRVQEVVVGTQRAFQQTHYSNEVYPQYTDLGFLSKASTTTDASVAFEMLIVDNNYI